MSEAEEMAKRLLDVREFINCGHGDVRDVPDALAVDAASLLCSQAAEIEALKSQLATARNDALEEAAKVAEDDAHIVDEPSMYAQLGDARATACAIASALRKMKEG